MYQKLYTEEAVAKEQAELERLRNLTDEERRFTTINRLKLPNTTEKTIRNPYHFQFTICKWSQV